LALQKACGVPVWAAFDEEAEIRTRSTSDKIDNTGAALLNDAIPVKFRFRTG